MIKSVKIFQLSGHNIKGSGIANVIFEIGEILIKLGYDTELKVGKLEEDVFESELNRENTIVFYHVYDSVDPLFPCLKCHKIMIFHNITNPDFFLTEDCLRNQCAKGMYDVALLKKWCEGVITFSEFSKDCLTELGWDSGLISVLPLPVRIKDLDKDYSGKVVEKFSRDEEIVNVLFAGRICRNKKQENLVRAIEFYKRKYNEKIRLFLTGGVASEDYYEEIKGFVHDHLLENNVIFVGQCSFSEYLAYYQLADVFLCMSEHEGFCIPIIEAMYLGVPVVALSRTAVPETIGGAGVCLDSTDPEDYADAIYKLSTDSQYRAEIIKNQNERVKEFSEEGILERYGNVIKKIVGSTKDHIPVYADRKEDFLLKYRRKPEQVELKRLKDSLAEISGQKTVVIYGAGKIGRKIYPMIRDIGIENVVICDSTADETEDKELNTVIYSPEYVFKNYSGALFIISIQSRSAYYDIVNLMLDNRISRDRIMVYDSVRYKLEKA